MFPILGKEMFISDERASVLTKPLVTSYEEYLEIDDRVEIIDGFVYVMASPIDAHQNVIDAMYVQFFTQLRKRKCHPYVAPFDVQLPMKSLNKEGRPSTFTIVQPNLFILCAPSKNKSKYIDGALDFIIEVLSDSTRSVNMVAKFYKCGAVGVKEYWMLDPVAKTIKVATLNDGEYEVRFVKAKGTVALKTLEGLSINFDEVFPAIIVSLLP